MQPNYTFVRSAARSPFRAACLLFFLLCSTSLCSQDDFEAEIAAIKELPWEERREQFQAALEAGKGTPLQQARYHHELGVAHFVLEDLFAAIEQTQEALDLRLEHEASAGEEVAHSAYNLGSFYHNLGHFDEAFAHFQLVVDRAPNSRLGYTLFRLGSLYRDLGEFQLSEKAFQDALQQSPYPDDQAERATLLAEWADLYLKQNTAAAAEEAIPLLEKAYRTYDELAGSDQYYASLAALCLNRLGLAYTQAEKFPRALDHYQKALTYNENCCQDTDLAASIFTNMGITYRRTDRTDQALEWHRRALDQRLQVAEKGKTNIRLAIAYDNLATTFLHLEQYRTGLEHIQQSLAWSLPAFSPTDVGDNPPANLLKASPNKNEILISLQDKAELWQALAEAENDDQYLERALATYYNCDQLIDLMREDHLEKSTKLYWREQAREMYQAAVKAAWMADRPEEAFYFSEKSRAVLLLDGLRDLNAHSRLPEGTQKELSQLASGIQYLQKLNYEARENDGALPEEKLSLLQEQYRHMLDSLENSYPDYYRQKYRPGTIDLQVLQRKLPAGSVWIEYFLGQDFSLAFVISDQETKIVELAAPRILQPHITALLNGLKQYDAAFDPEPATTLYRYLIEPLQLSEGVSITLVPDAQLYLIPFEVLVAGDPEGTPYLAWDFLLKKHRINYAFSASSHFFETSAADRGNGRVLAFAPMATPSPEYGVEEHLELPQTRFTTEYIARIFPTDVFLGREARRERLKEVAQEASVLHLATHAYLNHEQPEFSYFLVADTDPEQRRFYVNELYQYQYQADLAVLSACETGTGKLFRGEGVASIGRAFAQNGCPNLCMSLWPVDEGATSRLLEFFYQELKAGVPKGEALRQAKLNYLEQATAPQLQHPFRWSGFVYYGQDTPLALNAGIWSGLSYWLIPALLLAGLVFFFTCRKTG